MKITPFNCLISDIIHELFFNLSICTREDSDTKLHNSTVNKTSPFVAKINKLFGQIFSS